MRGVVFRWCEVVAALAALGVLLWPGDAWAWGPLAHLDFSQGALGHAHALPVAMRLLLGRCGEEFLYGSLAADIIVGKNLARYAVHCHNWKVGWGVLAKARGEAQQAFSLGFLAHLAADTVAHNYYVPYKTVEGFPVPATGHAYWELRYDQRLDPDLWKLARRVTRPDYRRHDEFLQEALVGSYVIPFGVSRRMFNKLLLAAKMKRWQAMSALYARERQLSLGDDEVKEARRLAVDQILGMLIDGEASRAGTADPTGGRNLHMAFQLRQGLRRARRQGLSPAEANRVLERSRPAFRDAIHGKLVLPDLPLSGLSAPARQAVEEAAASATAAGEGQLEDESVAREEGEDTRTLEDRPQELLGI